jgi:hypothetical protein
MCRKTGITLQDTGIRDEHGLEPMSGIFSSPGDEQHGERTLTSEGMDLQEGITHARRTQLSRVECTDNLRNQAPLQMSPKLSPTVGLRIYLLRDRQHPGTPTLALRNVCLPLDQARDTYRTTSTALHRLAMACQQTDV